jgi:hypothetical protein
VIARAFGTYPGLHGDQFVGATCDRFIGVFSADNQSQELAFIWKAEVVREILTSAAQKAR